MSHVVSGNQLCLAEDASSIGAGAVLQQNMGDQWRLISSFSKKLMPTETRYSTFERELLAAYSAVGYFRHLLGANFLYTYGPQALVGRFSVRFEQVLTP